MMIPFRTDFKTWANSLVIDFPTSNIPIYRDGMDWKIWGNAVAQEDVFAQNGVPGTNTYQEPLDWAKMVFKQMSNIP